ncbi:MAG: hypothetical protein E6Q06_02140 [Candidatus Moraniibacteriota bacterium]|nr:MAG: hypothetical protein E6Q06_02140 [Candidatus Moranbacteria bacterium]
MAFRRQFGRAARGDLAKRQLGEQPAAAAVASVVAAKYPDARLVQVYNVRVVSERVRNALVIVIAGRELVKLGALSGSSIGVVVRFFNPRENLLPEHGGFAVAENKVPFDLPTTGKDSNRGVKGHVAILCCSFS